MPMTLRASSQRGPPPLLSIRHWTRAVDAKVPSRYRVLRRWLGEPYSSR